MKNTPKIIVAPNSFKGSIDSFRICQIIKGELKKTISSNCIIDCIPIGDGGDGTAYIIARNLGAIKKYYPTTGPLGRRRVAPIYIHRHTAIIEMADVSGLRLVSKEDYNPTISSTEGLGKLISKLLLEGINKLILCIGGSATIDMGLGALKGMGAVFYDSQDIIINDINIKTLTEIKKIDSTRLSRFHKLKIDVLCDVENTLLGKKGAIRTYGEQKGVKAEDIDSLESQHFYMCKLLETISGKNLINCNHGGAAGGLTIGLSAFLDLNLYGGTDYVLDLLNFNDKLNNCKIIISGEGCMDSQSVFGKAPYIIAQRAASKKINCIAINGQTKSLPALFTKAFSLIDYTNEIAESIANPEPYIKKAANDIANLIIDNNILK
ncbi:MAG: glycerate kinase [Marinifilaceae bacterium]